MRLTVAVDTNPEARLRLLFGEEGDGGLDDVVVDGDEVLRCDEELDGVDGECEVGSRVVGPVAEAACAVAVGEQVGVGGFELEAGFADEVLIWRRQLRGVALEEKARPGGGDDLFRTAVGITFDGDECVAEMRGEIGVELERGIVTTGKRVGGNGEVEGGASPGDDSGCRDGGFLAVGMNADGAFDAIAGVAFGAGCEEEFAVEDRCDGGDARCG